MSDRLQYNPAEAFSASLTKNLDIASHSSRNSHNSHNNHKKSTARTEKSKKIETPGKLGKLGKLGKHSENSQGDLILYTFKKDIMDELRSINKRLDALEKKQVDVKDVQKSVSALQKQMAINEFTIGADDDLKNYLMSEKDNDMTESALTGGDIARGVDKINSKRRNRR